jgi:hypothetical protein
MTFNAKDLQNGRLNQQKARETPGSFASTNGTTEVNPTGDLSKSNRRMAGEIGSRAMEMMSNPQEQQRTANWMQMFSTSNQGMQWNQAKMGVPPQEQK